MANISNILDSITNYKAQAAKRAEQERIAAEEYRQNLCNRVRAMKPAINDLIMVAKAAQEAGIPLKSEPMNGLYYENGDFFAEAMTHKVGFVQASCTNEKIIGVGFEGGGYCGNYDFFTDGSTIYDKSRDNEWETREPITKHLEKFIEKFSEFEEAFYDYIEKATNREIPVKSKYYIEVCDYNDDKVLESRWFDSEVEAENWWKELGYFRSGDYVASLLKTNHPTNNEDDYDVEFVKYL